MKNKKILKIIGILALAGIVVGGAVGLYMFNMPHRDVQSTKTDFKIATASLIDEFLLDADAANERYLNEDGDSKILEVSGIVAKVSKDFNDNVVVILREPDQDAGVSCTFLSNVQSTASQIQIGQEIKVKGVFRSGAYYDEDLRMYEDVIIEKCDLVSRTHR
jgi:hypothetical protein